MRDGTCGVESAGLSAGTAPGGCGAITGYRFYEINSLSGRFWVQAHRASDAYRIARAILRDDEFFLALADDLQFAEVTDV